MNCDFCNTPNPQPWHRLTCQTFTVQVTGTLFGIPLSESVGDWLACETCKCLIDAGQWEDLALRCTDTFVERHPETNEAYDHILNHMRALHSEFRQMYLQTH